MFDELYDERWSVEANEPGVSEWLGVKGVSVAEVDSEGNAPVSSFKSAILGNFLADWLPRRKKAFQLGVLGPGEDVTKVVESCAGGDEGLLFALSPLSPLEREEEEGMTEEWKRIKMKPSEKQQSQVESEGTFWKGGCRPSTEQTGER